MHVSAGACARVGANVRGSVEPRQEVLQRKQEPIKALRPLLSLLLLWMSSLCRVPSSVAMLPDQPGVPGRRRWLHVHPEWHLRNGSALQARLEKRRYRIRVPPLVIGDVEMSWLTADWTAAVFVLQSRVSLAEESVADVRPRR